MDNHPIPQDVTGFQFKLIGNMTVKQFAYLATGVVFAWILFQLPINILIKFPFCAFSAILGIGLAYFPVSGRPMDTMIGNYLKALIRPTQFVYEKIGGQLYFPNKTPTIATRPTTQYKNNLNPFPKDKLKAYLESLNTQPKNAIDEKENNFLASVTNLSMNSVPRQTTLSQSANTPEPALQIITPTAPVNLSPYSDRLPPTKTAPQSPAIVQPAAAKPAASAPIAPTIKQELPPRPAPQEQLRVIAPTFRMPNRPTGTFSAPDSPSIITGITKDPRGNSLPNILVEVKDKDGNPVRAFKTNEVGRFASATPLTNGAYSIEFEDPKGQNKFEKISINITGQIIQPIEAVSVDTREELRRSLFAN